LEDWALILRLHLSERVPTAQIARDLGISRNPGRERGRVGGSAGLLAPAAGDEFRAVRGAGV